MKASGQRRIVLQSLCCAAAFAAGMTRAQQPMLEESDPTATSLGYREDSNKVDGAKYQRHAASQKCANCTLYQGKEADPAAACPLFAGKQVRGTGWCSAYSARSS